MGWKRITSLTGVSLLSLVMASTPIIAQEMETVLVSQNNPAQADDSNMPNVFYPGMSCAHLNDFEDNDFYALNPVKEKALLLHFCETEPLYTCSDYDAYLPEGFHLEPQGHGAVCKLLVRKKMR